MSFIKCSNKKCGAPIDFDYSYFEGEVGEHELQCSRCDEVTEVNLEFTPSLDVNVDDLWDVNAMLKGYEFRSTPEIRYAMDCLRQYYRCDRALPSFFEDCDWLAICQMHFLTNEGNLII